MAPVKAKFTEGEKVLCFHGPLIYEAKCVKVENKPQLKYFIHYNGWNKNWDEWVQESRVMKCTDANYQKQKELQRAHIAAKANKKTKAQVVKNQKVEKKPEKPKSTTPVPSVKKEKSVTSISTSGRRTREGTPRSSTPVQSAPSTPTSATVPPSASTSLSSQDSEPKKKRAKGDVLPPMVEPEEIHNTKIEVKIKIPEDLKPWLVDDWDLITRQYRLIKFPPKKSVKVILNDYLTQKTPKNKDSDSSIVEVVNGIREYFDVMLGAQLLYKFERIQYAELLAGKSDTSMSELYGGMHLLRLFVKIGGMLSYTRLDEKSMTALVAHLHDFLKYLSKNAGDLFSLSDYIVASPEYQRKAI